MPRYDYKCFKCNISVEHHRSINDESPVLCGICGQHMQRLISGCNFVLKGGGWGRDLTEKKERLKKSDKMGEKMREKEHYGEFQ